MADKPSLMNDANARIVMLQSKAVEKIRDITRGERLGTRKLTAKEKIENYLMMTPDDFMMLEQKYGPEKVMEYRFEMESLTRKSDQATLRKYGVEDFNGNL